VGERTSLVGSTGNMSVTSWPPGLSSFAQVAAHCSLTGGWRAHKNLRCHSRWLWMLFALCSHGSSVFKVTRADRHWAWKRCRARVVEADVELTALRLILEEVPCQGTEPNRVNSGAIQEEVTIAELISIGSRLARQQSPLMT